MSFPAMLSRCGKFPKTDNEGVTPNPMRKRKIQMHPYGVVPEWKSHDWNKGNEVLKTIIGHLYWCIYTIPYVSFCFNKRTQDRCIYTISCRSGIVQIGLIQCTPRTPPICFFCQETLEQFYLGYLGGCIRENFLQHTHQDSFRYLEWRYWTL